LTGSLKFVPVDADGNELEPRGARPTPRFGHKRQGKHMVGKRGRPKNIRHQGRRKR